MRQNRSGFLLYAVAVAVAAIATGNTAAQAVPILQLYLEGATYNAMTDTWELTAPGSSGGAPFRLWAIGNVGGQGSKGTITDVRMAAVYNSTVGPITITLTPSTTGDYNGFTDPLPLPMIPAHLQTVTDGSTPLLGDEVTHLPSHGEYGDGRTWQEFRLGDFDHTDSPLADFNGDSNNPTPETLNGAQINVYEISVTPGPGTVFGEHPFTIHFDLYNHVVAGNHMKYTFAPFSHDGEGDGGGTDATVTIVPEPSSLMMLMAGVIFGVTCIRRKTTGD